MKQQIWVADMYIGCFECPETPMVREVYMNDVVIPINRDDAPVFETFRAALLANGFREAPDDDDCLWWAGREPSWLLQAKLEAEFRKDPHREPMSVAIRWLETYARGGFSLVYRGDKDPQWTALLRRMRMGEQLEIGDFMYLETSTGMPANFWLDVSRRKAKPHEGGVLPEGTQVFPGDSGPEAIIPIERILTPEGVDVTAHGVVKEGDPS